MMKRWLPWLFLAVGVVMLLRVPHRPLSAHVHRQAAEDRSVLSQSEFVPTCCGALRAVSSAFHRNRAGPLEFSATRSAFLITDDGSPPCWTIEGPQILMRAVIKIWLLVGSRLAA